VAIDTIFSKFTEYGIAFSDGGTFSLVRFFGVTKERNIKISTPSSSPP